jgi:dTDP-4-amino-4,6-dideoxygalactose transaminase
MMTFDCPPWPPQWPEIETAIERVIRSGDWGRYRTATHQNLEKRLCETFGAVAARLCCSGTAALEIALRSIQLGSGDEVILAAYDYPGNFRTIELLGARPVLVDVASDSPCIDPGQLEQAASGQVRAVVASHLYGRAAEMARLREVCDDRSWILVEDACQVPGMEIDGRPAGSFGHFATLSFGGSKLISAGNGGALLADSARLAARWGALLDRPGDVFPLAPLQAAVIEPQLERLDTLNRLRRETARFIEEQVNSLLSRWRWLSGACDQANQALYKVAWTAESDEHRDLIVAAGQQAGLPLGSGFRSMSRCSERRCRKPAATPRSDRLGERLFVLDHRALMIEPVRYGELADCLQQIHDCS